MGMFDFLKKSWTRLSPHDVIQGNFLSNWEKNFVKYSNLREYFKNTVDGCYAQLQLNSIALIEFRKKDYFREFMEPSIARAINRAGIIELLLTGGAIYEANDLLRANLELFVKLNYCIKKSKLEDLKTELFRDNLESGKCSLGNTADLFKFSNIDYALFKYLCNFTHNSLLEAVDVLTANPSPEDHDLIAYNLGSQYNPKALLSSLVLNNNILCWCSSTLDEYLNTYHADRFTKLDLEKKQIPQKDFEALKIKVLKIKEIKIAEP